MDRQKLIGDLTTEIYYELDTMNFMSKLCNFAIENDTDLETQYLTIIFRDIINHSDRISDLVEQLGKLVVGD